MEIDKSTMHNKIIGNFGEYLICNWLSRSGFEVTIVDHTGIDIVAYNPRTKERLGITVKSRTREKNKEDDPVNLFSYQNNLDSLNDRQKVENACTSFACDPWIAVYVETSEYADIYLTSLANYDEKYQINGRKIDDWKMTKINRIKYENDPKVKHIKLKFDIANWNW